MKVGILTLLLISPLCLPNPPSRHTETGSAGPGPAGQVLRGGLDPVAAAGASLSSRRGLAVTQPDDPTWVSTGDLGAARYDYTLTLLSTGQVLAVGGVVDPLTPSLSSAELYDPASGVWTPTGSLTTGRALHTATLLPSGQVLVAGGESTLLPPTALSSSELYDPTTGLWTPTGDLTDARVFHTATLLANGQVLAVGGINFTSSLASAELYDPTTGLWTETGTLAVARGGQTATLLQSGQVIVCGGYDPSIPPPGVLSSAEVYDPTSGLWTATSDLGTARYDHTATLLPSGQVLAVGGFSGTAILTSVELYDPVAGSWTATGDLAAPRRVHTATLLPSGQVLVAGGVTDAQGLAASSAELYDPIAGQWTLTSSLAMARFAHGVVLLPSGQVLVAGGRTKTTLDGVTLSSAELYF